MALQTTSAFYNFAMKTKLSSLSICGLILILLPLTLSSSPPVHSSGSSSCRTDKSIPIHERIACFVAVQNKSDRNNHPVKRTVQLYSRASKLHIQIMKTELDARGRDGSGYARLVLESDNFGRIKIRGENTNRYLCLSKTGDLVTRVKKQRFSEMRRCIFKEEITSEGYNQYRSVRYPEWFIGFSKGGRPRSGSKSAKRQIYRHFTQRVLPDHRRSRKHRREAKQLTKIIIKLLRKKLQRRRA
ncbi:Fibroblast growth factor 18 [Desmophyllum pertusum]|uniref:Fibroblast growth factor 18 n=1 Tax=Desmophyllum pertusum TaxID=174260 RepID=A0A9X0CFS2_9CNID|nr:Fibroblast growth factor 18 [Desmophyllum pertusum]